MKYHPPMPTTTVHDVQRLPIGINFVIACAGGGACTVVDDRSLICQSTAQLMSRVIKIKPRSVHAAVCHALSGFKGMENTNSGGKLATCPPGIEYFISNFN